MSRFIPVRRPSRKILTTTCKEWPSALCVVVRELLQAGVNLTGITQILKLEASLAKLRASTSRPQPGRRYRARPAFRVTLTLTSYMPYVGGSDRARPGG